MIKNIPQITRIYALPMSIFCWCIAFIFAYNQGGNIFYGLIALIGICLVHLGVNIFDDYVDYKLLQKGIDENGKNILLNAQKGKCEAILKNIISAKQMLLLALSLFFIAILIGIFFMLKVGFGVLSFMIITGILCLFYPIAGKFRLCEIILSTIYGPLLFGGVFYVMKSYYDWHTLIICLPIMLITLNLLYTDTILDYDIDKKEGKKTIANWFSTKWGSYYLHIVLITMIYLSVVLVYYMKLSSVYVFFTFLTLPIAINLLSSIKQYIIDPSILPKKTILDGITENWENVEKEGSQSFMLRMYQARNFMVAFSIIFGVTLLM